MIENKNRLTVLLCTVAAVLLLTALIVVCIEVYALGDAFFEHEYDKLSTAQSIGISQADLSMVTHGLLAYTRGEAESLDMQATIRGELREVFGQREKDHMVDVRDLYLGARFVRTFGLIAAAALTALAFFLMRRRAWAALCRAFLSVSAAFLALIAVIGIWAMLDFASFWTAFHHVFFTNDLWILNPNTDVLIMMVPQQFFSDLVSRILTLFVIVFVTLNAAAALGLLINRKGKA